jgi:SOS-response transcriptional repressor LexA
MATSEVPDGEHEFGRDAVLRHLTDAAHGHSQVGGECGVPPSFAVKPRFEVHADSLGSTKPKVKPYLNRRVYALLNMDAYRKTRLQQLIDTRYEGNQKAFGEAVGLSKGRVSQLLDKDEPFGERAAASLVEKLRLPDRWFDQGAGNVSNAAIGERRIPVISPVQAGNFREIVDAFAMGAGDNYLSTDSECSPYTFALQVEGRSMLPDFEEGDRVIIDPDIRPHSGDFVVARNSKGGATFKKYRIRGSDQSGREVFELIPLNVDEFDSVRSDMEPLEIIGTMIEHRKYRRRR